MVGTESATQLNRDIMVKTGTGHASINITAGPWHRRISYTAAGLPEYVGVAKVGVGTATQSWQISKNEYDAVKASQTISVIWGSGNANFDKRWTNRAAYTYF